MPTLVHNRTHVPAESVGLARLLRGSLFEPADIAKHEINRIVGLLQPKQRFTPMPRFEFLRRIVERWKNMPSYGRLETFAEFKDGKMRLAELRCTPTRLRYNNWESDDWEFSISICSTIIISKPPMFVHEKRDLAAFGLHSVARKIERGLIKTDEAILRDMLCAAQNVADQKAEFEIRCDNGMFVGELILVTGKIVNMVRTFINGQ